MTYNWHKKRAPVGHMDDWLMTYSDMITLLLCFFVVFLSATIIKESNPPPQEVVQIVQEPPKQVEQVSFQLPFSEPEPEPKETITTEPIVEMAEAPLVLVPNADPTANKVMQNNFEQRGDRITSLEMDSSAFFDSGSANISESGKAILRDVAANLKQEQFKDYQITVEGHTDDSPINTTAFPSNWELSTARASAVVHFFLSENIPAQKLRAAGYADTFPKAPNRDAGNKPIPENQAQNRRVVIKLEKIDKMT